MLRNLFRFVERKRVINLADDKLRARQNCDSNLPGALAIAPLISTKIEDSVFIDWLSFTFKLVEGSCDNYFYDQIFNDKIFISFLEYFKLSKFDSIQEEYGLNGYQYGLKVGENIKVYFAGKQTKSDDYMTCQVLMTGVACREIETLRVDFDWLDFIRFLKNDLMVNFKRIDFSRDTFNDKYFTLKDIVNKVLKLEYTSPVKKYSYILGASRNGYDEGETIYIGSYQSSKRYMRIYNKKLERESTDLNIWINQDIWVRFEYVLQGEYADLLAEELINSNSLIEKWNEVVLGFLMFKDTELICSINKNAKRIDNWKPWLDFCSCNQISKLKQVKIETTIERKEHYIMRMVSKMLIQLRLSGYDLNFLIKIAMLAKLDDLKSKDLVPVNRYLKSKKMPMVSLNEAREMIKEYRKQMVIDNETGEVMGFDEDVSL